MESLERRAMLSVTAAAVGRSPVLKGIAAIGDSITDEYQTHAPFRTPHRSWVEILADQRKLNFGSYSVSERPQPRAAGYQFNWARDGATTKDLVTDRQHVGVANAAKAGSVSLVFIHAGHNEFSQLLRSSDPVEDIQTLPERATQNLQTVVNTILAANPNTRVVIATLFDVSYVPSVQLGLSTGVIPQQAMPYVRAAQGQLNANIKAMASDPRVAVADVAGMYDKFLTRPVLKIGGEVIAKSTPGSDASNFWTLDAVHPGTVGQALIANSFIAAANAKFSTAVRPLTGQEIMTYAKQVSSAGSGLFSTRLIDFEDAPDVKSSIDASTLLGLLRR